MWVYIIYSLIVCMGKNCPLVHPICPLVDTFTGFRFYNILVVNLFIILAHLLLSLHYILKEM